MGGQRFLRLLALRSDHESAWFIALASDGSEHVVSAGDRERFHEIRVQPTRLRRRGACIIIQLHHLPTGDRPQWHCGRYSRIKPGDIVNMPDLPHLFTEWCAVRKQSIWPADAARGKRPHNLGGEVHSIGLAQFRQSSHVDLEDPFLLAGLNGRALGEERVHSSPQQNLWSRAQQGNQ